MKTRQDSDLRLTLAALFFKFRILNLCGDREMKVDIRTLENGVYSFDFEANLEALELAGHDSFMRPVGVKSTVEKSEGSILVTSRVVARLSLECDNCLKDFESELKDDFQLLYTTDKLLASSDDEMVRLISDSTHEIDLTEGVRDSLLLAMPMKITCSQDCKGLCPQCGQDLNIADCSCQPDRIDPRWDALKKLVE